MLTSLSPQCHPASAGLRRDWPLPKLHSGTSAIHKRQPLTSSPSPTPYLLHFSCWFISALPSEQAMYCSPAILGFFFLLFSTLPKQAVVVLLFLSFATPSLPLYLVPTEKFLTHYILNWKPAECGGCELGAAGRSSSKPPALTLSALPTAQYYHCLHEIS